MKLLFVLAVIVGLTAGAPKIVSIRNHVTPFALLDDILEILALVPIDDIRTITDEHLKNDAEFCEVVHYLQSDDWKNLVAEVDAKPEVQEFKQYLSDAGLPVDLILEVIAQFLDGLECNASAKPRTLRSWLDEIEAVTPFDKMRALLDDKMENSQDMKDLYAKISSDDAKALVEEVRQLPEVQRLAQRLTELGVRVDEVFAAVYAWLGWGNPDGRKHISPYALLDDILEILALVPIDDIRTITDEHLKNDAEFCEVVHYLQSDDWKNLVAEVDAKPEVQEFKQYLSDAGLPVDLILEVIAQFLDGLECNASESVKPRTLRTWLDEIEAVTPFDKMRALLDDKMENSQDMKDLYAKISSDDAKALVEEVRQLPEVQRLAQRLTEMGVRVDEVFAAVYAWLGWGNPDGRKHISPYALLDDILEILALVPIDDIRTITDEHLKNDAEFCEVVHYLQSDDWKNLVAEVDAKPEVQEFKQYLSDAGLPVDLILEVIAQFLDGLECNASAKPRTLRTWLDEIEAVTPFDKMRALLDDKMENSQDMKDLYAKISSDDAKALVEEVRQLPEVQRLAQRLTEMGVRVDEVFAAVYAWLGWGDPGKY